VILAAASDDVAIAFLELGAIILGLAVVARFATRLGFSPIPAYLIAGLAFGEGGAARIDVTEEFVELGAEIGVILLLLTLGLEYSAEELRTGLRRGAPVGALDAAANFTPGFVAGLLLGWDPKSALLLGGVTYISSSGVIAKVLSDLQRLGNRETPTILSVLVIEDLVMALYLPLTAVALAGSDFGESMAAVSIALAVVAALLFVALRYGAVISRFLSSPSDEVALLTVLGVTLVVAGLAQRAQVSAAVGAFLVGIAVSGPLQERAAALIGPLRDLFAATFFLFFSLQIDPADLPPVALVAGALAVVTAATKIVTGWWGATRAGIGVPGRVRAGTALVARGEFSIVIAGLGVTAGVDPDLAPLAAGYVLLLAVAGPVLTRYADVLARWWVTRTARVSP
jgi:CPA2 family monovalent cation:H+ antiporter-2